MPRQNSSRCWNPAVPPPPVLGAWAGSSGEAGDGGPGDGGGGDAAAALDAGALDAGALGEGVPGVEALAVPLAEAVGVAGLDPPELDPLCGNEGGVVGVEPDEQAETSAVVSTASVAQPKTVRRTRRKP